MTIESEKDQKGSAVEDALVTGPSAAAESSRPARRSGNPGFAGYEYQIDVTVWAALDLILAKCATDSILIEPPSDEDFEASVENPAAASSWATTGGGIYKVSVQAKSRSGSPWTTKAIAHVLQGRDEKEKEEEGETKRQRPLEMLQNDPTLRYVFVTNEASAGGLRLHEGEHLLDFPDTDVLPPHSRADYDADAQASLAPRILLLTGVTLELLASRIGLILSQHGHVPPANHNDCLEDLRKAVRARMRGDFEGKLTRADVVTILVGHGGSLSPTRDMDRYVRPRSFATIKAKLDTEHAVVIAGPSGTGKTLTADILEYELRQKTPPFAVVGEEDGPGGVRKNLLRADPIVFHLRDPWGGNRLTPGADRWSDELPKLLLNAGPGRKFLVTSRSDVLGSAAFGLVEELQPYIVTIEVEDYGPDRIAEIYDGLSHDLGAYPKRLAANYRQQALVRLTRPYEIKRFLVALARENEQQPTSVSDLLADSQIIAISNVIASQMAPLGAGGGEAAAVIWALLNAQGAASRELFAKLARRMRTADPNMRPDIDGMIDFLVAGQNLRQDGSILAFQHPRVEDGLRIGFMKHPRDAERVLSVLAETLLEIDRTGEDWGGEIALRILRSADKLDDLTIELNEPAETRLDRHLEARAFSSELKGDFEGALRDLARFGSPHHLPSRLAGILLARRGEGGRFAVHDNWSEPKLSEDDLRVLREDKRTKPMLERFIREALPFVSRRYSARLVALIDSLAPGIADPYWHALESVAGPGGPNENIDVIVLGALSGLAPDYDRAIERFARSSAEADDWFTKNAQDKYLAEEHGLDADHADHLIEEPSEQYYCSEQGLNAIVRIRRERDGVDWITGSPHKSLLLAALGRNIAESRRTPPVAELEFLLEHAHDWNRMYAWRAAGRHWSETLRSYLTKELARADIGSADHRFELLKIAAINGEGDPLPDLIAASNLASSSRRLEMVLDVFTVRLEDDPRKSESSDLRRERGDQFVSCLTGEEQQIAKALLEVLAQKPVASIAADLTAESRSFLAAIVPKISVDVAGPLVCLAGAAGIAVESAVDRLLATDDANDGKMALQAVMMANNAGLRSKLYDALKHRRFPVRCAALDLLSEDSSQIDRDSVLALASDHSAEVRLAFAQHMQALKWPEAVDALVTLLDDERDFAFLRGGSALWSRLAVARAAGHALRAYESLPQSAVDALVQHATVDGRDPFVACASLSALATREDPRIPDLILTALRSPGMESSQPHRPKAQAAAWALWDRVVDGKLDVFVPEAATAAEHEEAHIACPVLAAFGLHATAQREQLLARLETASKPERGAIVRTAAAASDASGLDLKDHEKVLVRLANNAALEDLSPDERALVEAWSKRLVVDNEWQRFVAWIASAVFNLPIGGDVGNIREFSLPRQTRVLSLRSLTSFRETGMGGFDDGT